MSLRRCSRLTLASGILVAALAGCASRLPEATDLSDRVGRDAGSRAGVPWTGEGRLLDDALDELVAAPLTVDSAVKIALLASPAARATYERLGVARADLLQAGLLRNPVIEASVAFFEGPEEVELRLAASFVDLFLRPLRRRLAESELHAAEAKVTRELVMLVFAVRRAMLDLAEAEEARALRRAALESAKAGVELMHMLREAGNVPLLPVRSEEEGLARARLDLAEAELLARDAREPVNVLLGLWGERTGWTLDPAAGEHDEPPPERWQGVESRAIAASLDLKADRAMLGATAQRVGLASWETVFPDADLGAVANREGEEGWGFGPAASVSLPVFDFGQARQELATAEVRGGWARHEALAIEIRSAARRLRERYLSLKEQADFMARTMLPARSRVLAETLRQYNAMQLGAFEVLRARALELEAQVETVSRRYAAAKAWLDLEELLAGCLNRERVGMPARSGHRVSRRPDSEGGH